MENKMTQFRIEYKYQETNASVNSAWQHNFQIVEADNAEQADAEFKSTWSNPATLEIKEVFQVGAKSNISNVRFAGIDNPCICFDISKDLQKKLTELCGINFDFNNFISGDGDEGMISVQYPISAESQTYVAGVFEDDFERNEDENGGDYSVLVAELVKEAEEEVSERDFMLEKCFGTSNIKSHETPVEHGYYPNIGSIVIFENMDEENMFYVGFESHEHNNFEKEEFLEFASYDEARAFITSDEIWQDGETVQDFSISHRLWNHIQSKINY